MAGGNFSDVRGIERLVAFFAREPKRELDVMIGKGGNKTHLGSAQSSSSLGRHWYISDFDPWMLSIVASHHRRSIE